MGCWNMPATLHALFSFPRLFACLFHWLWQMCLQCTFGCYKYQELGLGHMIRLKPLSHKKFKKMPMWHNLQDCTWDLISEFFHTSSSHRTDSYCPMSTVKITESCPVEVCPVYLRWIFLQGMVGAGKRKENLDFSKITLKILWMACVGAYSHKHAINCRLQSLKFWGCLSTTGSDRSCPALWMHCVMWTCRLQEQE